MGRVNRMETVCILILIFMLGFVNGTNFGSNGDSFWETVLAVFLLSIMAIPLLMVLFEGVTLCRHSATRQISKERFLKIQNRKATAQSTAGKGLQRSVDKGSKKTELATRLNTKSTV